MNNKKILFWIAIVLAVFSVINIWWEILSGRWLRLLTSTIFLLTAMRIIGFKKLWGLFIFGLLMLCDFLILEWEAMFAKHAYYTMHILIMLFLLLLTFRELKWKNISLFEIVPAFLFFFVNLWILWTIKDNFYTEEIVLETLFLMNGFFTILLVIFGFVLNLNNLYNSSTFFFLGVLGLVVSELMLEFKMLRYVDSLFYIFGLFFLLKAFLENKIIKKSNHFAPDKEEIEEEPSETKYLKTYQ